MTFITPSPLPPHRLRASSLETSNGCSKSAPSCKKKRKRKNLARKGLISEYTHAYTNVRLVYPTSRKCTVLNKPLYSIKVSRPVKQVLQQCLYSFLYNILSWKETRTHVEYERCVRVRSGYGKTDCCCCCCVCHLSSKSVAVFVVAIR